MTIDEALDKIRPQVFSKRRRFFRGLEVCVHLRHKHAIAWPDLLLFVLPEDIDTSFKFVEQNDPTSIEKYGLEEG